MFQDIMGAKKKFIKAEFSALRQELILHLNSLEVGV
jgi:hypothetical protein